MNIRKDLRVFIVDDNSFCRELYGQYLKNLGFGNIHLFNDVTECLSKLQSGILFLDQEMETDDGVAILKKVKRLCPDLYVVILCRHSYSQGCINALKHGAFDCISKGHKEQEMIAAVTDKIIHMMQLLKASKNAIPIRQGMLRL